MKFIDLKWTDVLEELKTHNNTIITHDKPDLDNLCCIYLCRQYIPDVKVIFTPIEEIKNDNSGVLIDVPNGFIEDKGKGSFISSSKKMYLILTKHDIKNTTYRNLVDYVDRNDRNLLERNEKSAGSFVHSIYVLRSKIAPNALLTVFQFLSNAIVYDQLNPRNMCDMEIMRAFPDYSAYIIDEDITTDEIIQHQVTMTPVSNKVIVLNKSDHNITIQIFRRYKDAAALIYYSPSGQVGILFNRKRSNLFNKENILVTLNSKEPDAWEASRDAVRFKTGKESTRKTKISSDELIELLIQNKYF